MVFPLASLLATEQVSLGDVLSIDWDGIEAGLRFSKESEGAVMPMTGPIVQKLKEAAAASSDGRPVPATSTLAAGERLPMRPLR